MRIVFLFIAMTYSSGINVDCEVYITPRNVTYGAWDSGVFNFELDQKSERVLYKDRTYYTKVKRDSLYELFYCQSSLDDLQARNLFDFSGPIHLPEKGYPRIMIIIHHNNGTDSMLIDNNLNVRYRGQTFHANNNIINYLYGLMPVELKDNWTNNSPGRVPLDDKMR